MPHDVIATCPVCSGELAVTRLRCGDCGTVIEGEFGVGRFARLTREQTVVLESFLRSRGNLRDMERELGISYPTVRVRVEALIRALGFGPRDEADAAAAATDDEAPADSGRGRHHRRGCDRGSRRDPGRTPRDPRAAVPPRADRRGGRRGHPRAGEDPMTEMTSQSLTTRELPLDAGGEVEILVTATNVRLRGVDGDSVTVSTRDGEPIDDEVEIHATPGRIKIRDDRARPQVRSGPREHPQQRRPRHRRPADGARQPAHAERRRPRRGHRRAEPLGVRLGRPAPGRRWRPRVGRVDVGRRVADRDRARSKPRSGPCRATSTCAAPGSTSSSRPRPAATSA